MESCSGDLEHIQGRLLKLERENRRFKQLGAFALIATASLLVMGQASPKKTVEANEFILRDGSARVRARLSMNAALASPELLLFDETGKERVKLSAGMGPSGFLAGGVSVFDEHGRERGVLRADDHGAFLSILDLKGFPTASLSSGKLRQTSLFLMTTARTYVQDCLW